MGIGRWLSVSILVLGLLLCVYFDPSRTVTAEPILIPGDRPLMARLYEPKTAISADATVLLLHGINNHKGMMAPLGVALARRGMAALALDFGGFGESYGLNRAERSLDGLQANTLKDAEAAVAWLRSQPRFQSTRLGVVGHSMGGLTALQLAQANAEIRGTVMLSMSAEFAEGAANLLLGVGAYEQLNPATAMREMLPEPSCQQTVCGEFAAGTARKLTISPTADHVIAPYDPILMAATVDWLAQALALPSLEMGLVAPGFVVGWLLVFGGGIATGTAVFVRSQRSLVAPNVRKLWRYVVSGLMGVLILMVWGLSGTTGAASQTLLFCLGLQICANAALVRPQRVGAAVRLGLLYGCSIALAFWLPAVLCGLGELWRQPGFILSMPQFLVQWLAFVAYNLLQILKPQLFGAYSFDVRPSWLFWGIVALEIWQPGAILTGVALGFRYLLRGVRQPWQLTGLGEVSPRSLGAIALLLVLLGVVVSWRVADGLLEVAARNFDSTARTLGLWLLFPVVFLMGLWRSRGFRRAHAAILGGDDGTV